MSELPATMPARPKTMLCCLQVGNPFIIGRVQNCTVPAVITPSNRCSHMGGQGSSFQDLTVIGSWESACVNLFSITYCIVQTAKAPHGLQCRYKTTKRLHLYPASHMSHSAGGDTFHDPARYENLWSCCCTLPSLKAKMRVCLRPNRAPPGFRLMGGSIRHHS